MLLSECVCSCLGVNKSVIKCGENKNETGGQLTSAPSGGEAVGPWGTLVTSTSNHVVFTRTLASNRVTGRT